METDSTSAELRQSILDEEDASPARGVRKPSLRRTVAGPRAKAPTRWVPTTFKTVKAVPKAPKEPSGVFRPKSIAPNVTFHKRDQGVGLMVVYYPGERDIEFILSSIKGLVRSQSGSE